MVDEELAGLLAAGERAVFRGVPGQGLIPLQRAQALAADVGDDERRARAAWLVGVCQTAIGSYGPAIAGLAATANDAALPEQPRSLAASAVASVLRQLGRHQEARAWDSSALDLAGSSEEAAVDAWLGLTSDAVGLADPTSAHFALGQVEELVASRPLWWRQGIRCDWVRAEIDLLMDAPAQARVVAERALDSAEAANAPRHVAKSLLFAGVAAAAQGQWGGAVDLLSRAAVLAEGLGARPLVWPSRALLGALQAQSDPTEAQRSLEAARAVVREIAAELPQPLADDWLARPDIHSLMT